MAYRPARATRIGDMRDFVTLQERQQTGVDDFNQPIFGFVDIARVAARVEPLRGGEKFSAADLQWLHNEFLNIYIRWRSDVLATWRMTWERNPSGTADTLEILSIANPDERRRFLKIGVRNSTND